MERTIITDNLLFASWTELSGKLFWAYQGKPIRRTGRFETKHLSAWLIRRGWLTIGDSNTTIVRAGHWVLAPHQAISREFSEDAEILSIKFTLQWPDGQLLFQYPEVLILPSRQFPDLEKSGRQLLRIIKRHQIDAGNLMQFQALGIAGYFAINQKFQLWQQAYISSVLSSGHRPQLARPEDTRLLKIKHLLDEHPLGHRLDLKEIGASVGLSFGHADTLFGAAFGQTMHSYFEERKFQAACYWLKGSSKPIKGLSYELGFSDAAALTHWFKRRTNISPRDYRAGFA